MVRPSPGPCPICGAAHTACTADSGPITAVQLPLRDASAARPSADAPLDLVARQASARGAVGDAAPLGDGSDERPFSTATYRGDPKQRRRR